MSSPIKLSLFCQNAGFSTGQPGKPVFNLAFTLAPKSDKVDESGNDIFADAQGRQANLNLQNVSPEIIAQFANAPRVNVTIEIVE